MCKADINKLIGSRIKCARKDLSLTLLEVAQRMNLSEGNVQRYEAGNIANVSISVLLRFADVLQVSPEHLLGWSDKAATVELPLDEEKLLGKYRQLSDDGKEYVMDQVDFRLEKEAAKARSDAATA